MDIEVLGQQTICGNIPRLKHEPWDAELSDKRIWIADYGEGEPEIELLIGEDYCGQLSTGNMKHLQCGLIACETLGMASYGKNRQ
ncbi:hypothetical protein JTE90_010487 [Oedothorax gibbosus]|uniref:Uncharacterized protein n=1 Tax=Oedothorax gibbosus TaxID=931172 RepID=A0AAV6W642_9ARAC|nr:hypothetical protein JTE90_010487 [Oedothorax gibbosus]